MNVKSLTIIELFVFIFVTEVYPQYQGLEIPQRITNNKGIVIKRKGYTLLFNPQENIPVWVAWKLDKSNLVEKTSRKGFKFIPDPNLSSDNAVVTKDYSNSGYDRGHMCPAADNKWDEQAMKESFYMTNICPQHPNLNGGDWHELEKACRNWAENGRIYIVCGPILYKKAQYGYIGKEHKIRVPEAFFKVILAGLDIGNPRGIGYILNNEASNNSLDFYINTIDYVERITGLDFFSSLPDDVENKVESELDMREWE